MDLPGGDELDSDMADITQSILGGEEDVELPAVEMDTFSGKLDGLISAEHDGISASSHIASSLGINPHTLQVELPASSTKPSASLRQTPPESLNHLFCWQIMKASLFAEDEEESDMFQDHGAVKVSADVSSPRLVLPGAQSRPSGRKLKLPSIFIYLFEKSCVWCIWTYKSIKRFHL